MDVRDVWMWLVIFLHTIMRLGQFNLFDLREKILIIKKVCIIPEGTILNGKCYYSLDYDSKYMLRYWLDMNLKYYRSLN